MPAFPPEPDTFRPDARWFSFDHKGDVPVRECPDIVRVTMPRHAALELVRDLAVSLAAGPESASVEIGLYGVLSSQPDEDER